MKCSIVWAEFFYSNTAVDWCSIIMKCQCSLFRMLIMCWNLLKSNFILIFDDKYWLSAIDSEHRTQRIDLKLDFGNRILCTFDIESVNSSIVCMRWSVIIIIRSMMKPIMCESHLIHKNFIIISTIFSKRQIIIYSVHLKMCFWITISSVCTVYALNPSTNNIIINVEPIPFRGYH